MDVAQAMTREVVSVEPAAGLREVALLLAERGLKGVPVVDREGGVLGVVSRGDLIARRGATAREAMSASVCIGAERPLREAAEVMTSRGLDCLPVVGDAGRLVGVVTRADLVRAFARPDDEIAAELRRELGDGIDVVVEHGEATLRGVVPSRRAIAELRRRGAGVPGVVAVTTRLIAP